MPDLPLSDISFHYEVDGSGPPLLMLAGMLSDSASWGALAPLLSDHFTWIFATGFFSDPKNTETALSAALAYPHAQSAEAMAHQLEALRSFRPTVRPSDLTCPTQVLHGAEDLMIPRAAAEEAFAQIPNVVQATLPDAGHSIHWDAAPAVAQYLRQFHDTAGDPR